MIEPTDTVVCRICGATPRQMTAAHLKMHGVTTAEYKQRFPGVAMLSEAAKIKLSEQRKGKARDPDIIRKMHAGRDAAPKRKGYTQSRETREKIASKARGRTLSPEHRRSIAEAGTGRVHSPETVQKMRDHHASLSPADYASRRTKSIATWVQKYGCLAVHDPAVRAKIEQTNMERYGGISPTCSAEIVARIKATWLERYPEHGHPQHDDAVRAKIEATCLDRYGSSSAMHIARQAFLDGNEGRNPFQVEEIKDRIRASLSKRFGAHVTHPKLKDVSAETVRIMRDFTQMSELISSFPLRTIADQLEVNETTVARRCDALGIPRYGTSIERAIAKILEDIGIDYQMRSRKVIPPLELDIVIPSVNLAIEIGGIYWHSDRFLSPAYHLRKLMMCQEAGYRLLTIFEDEIVNKRDIVEARLRYMLGHGRRGDGARKLVVKNVDRDIANAFYERHHIQGGSRNNHYNFGAYDRAGNLVAAMSFKESWRLSHLEDTPFELTRFATDGRSFPGLASKMFAVFTDRHDVMRVVTYADRRWSEGDLYSKMGFEQTRIGLPSYSYVHGKDMARLDKSKFRRKNIEHLVEDGPSKSEIEIMQELGYARIYDCGTIRFDWVQQGT